MLTLRLGLTISEEVVRCKEDATKVVTRSALLHECSGTFEISRGGAEDTPKADSPISWIFSAPPRLRVSPSPVLALLGFAWVCSFPVMA